MMKQTKITDDIEALLAVLPPFIATALHQKNRFDELLEVVIDLGRVPEARYTFGEEALANQEVNRENITYVVERVGTFTADNRAGIERTLHRISCIRNRRGEIVGLTCRVGRAVYGTIDIIEDLILSGKSLLLLGRPGVGKTTLLREAARILAEKKRVVIVDTSNEIGGDGDIPHPSIGRARRMQVAEPNLQHEVMIEAVENHMPEVIVIDEIGRELEALAARTIAERGVQLIGTAHGNTLENLLTNPTLSDLVGGVESVTLGDEEARRRGTQKTVLERRARPTFDILVEIKDRHHLVVHKDVAQAADDSLRGHTLTPELRYRDEEGNVHVEEMALQNEETVPVNTRKQLQSADTILHVFPYGISHDRLRKAATHLSINVEVVKELPAADVLLTMKNYYRRFPPPIAQAEQRNIPVYVLRTNTVTQIENALTVLLSGGNGAHEEERGNSELAAALTEAEAGIQKVLAGAPSVELRSQKPAVRRRQHELVRAYHLISHSYGREPNRRLRIYRE